MATLKDSGDRTAYSTGAVRDLKEGKGRFDLMPMDIVHRVCYGDPVLHAVSRYQETGDDAFLCKAAQKFAEENDKNGNVYSVMLEVAKHFEDGAKKYGENNWQKGIPVSSYIDSAIRHYCKFKAGWDDEPHDRAFVWNIICAMWTINHKQYLVNYPRDIENETDPLHRDAIDEVVDYISRNID